VSIVTLQSGPALGPPLVVFALLLVVGVVLGGLGSAVVRRLSNPVGKYRLLYVGVLFPFALLSYGVLALLGLGPAVAAATLGGAGGVVATLGADFAGFLAAGCVGLAAYTPTIRGVRSVRGVDLSTRKAFARMARYVVGLSAVAAALILPLRLGPGTTPLALAGLFAVVLSVLIAVSPWFLTAVRSTVTPDAATRDRLRTLRDRAGLDVRDARVFDTDDEETATVHVRGPPGYRRLFVTTTFLDRFDDATATALLAIQAGQVRRHLLVRRAGTAILAAVPLVAAVAGREPRWLLLGVAVAVVLVGFWACRRAVCGADDDAAARVGGDAVADALERYAAVHAMEPTRRRVPNPLSANVALGDRIDRLRGR
jgi:STE24 endopeptidase